MNLNDIKPNSVEYLQLLEELEKRLKYNKLDSLFPDDGRYARANYPKQLRFFEAGNHFKQRLLAGGNRVGKTLSGGVEMTYHLTGLYPKWWKGKKFLNPIKAWAVGKSNQVVKEVMQDCLLGPITDMGSGLIPEHLIIDTTRKAGVANTIEMVQVQHVSGGVSELIFKSYEQGRGDFQGTKKQVIWMDEEPRDYGIFEECLMRTMDDISPGIIYITFTPLLGLTPLVRSFLNGGRFSDNGTNPTDSAKFAIQVTWEDIPHLSVEQKDEMKNSIAPHLRDARTKGIPSLGAGAVYPFSEDDIMVKPFEIPYYWPKAYGFDVGVKRTAAIWTAFDPDSGIYYLYSEHYLGNLEKGINVVPIHADALKARGAWIPGVIDTSALRANEIDGTVIYEQYVDQGLNLEMANKAVEAGVLKICQMFAAGRIKVFNTCQNWLQEFRTYSRDEKTGKIAEKQEDHLMDAMRYLFMACPDVLQLEPDPDAYRTYIHAKNDMDSITGY